MKIKKNVLLSKYTTFKIGGPAKFFVEVENIDELKEALKYAKNNQLNFFILGSGSNILASDRGFDGLIIRMKLNQIKIDNNIIDVEAGVNLAKIIDISVQNNLSGLEWAAGIPGTLGGAIRGNAGAFGGEMKDNLIAVTYLDTNNSEIKTINNENCQFSYRQSIFKKNNNWIIVSAKIKLQTGRQETIKNKILKILKERAKKQPKVFGCSGSFFMNPTVGKKTLIEQFEKESGQKVRDVKLPAAWLIEKVGLKGKKIGGAMISQKHANFFINTGNAKADEVEILVSLVKQQVRDKLGVQLQEEVQYLGF